MKEQDPIFLTFAEYEEIKKNAEKIKHQQLIKKKTRTKELKKIPILRRFLDYFIHWNRCPYWRVCSHYEHNYTCDYSQYNDRYSCFKPKSELRKNQLREWKE